MGEKGADGLSARQLLSRIRKRVSHPATVREVMRALGLPRSERTTLRRRLTQLVEVGELVRIRGNRYGLADRMDLVVGRLVANPRGFGFVTPDASERATQDVYVSGGNLGGAMHGDRVTVRVERVAGRLEGRIIRVLERAAETLPGRYETDGSGVGYVVAFDPRLTMDLQVPADADGGARSGDVVIAQIERWPTPTRNPVGRVVEVLGRLEDPGVDTRLVIRKYDLEDEDDPAAVDEAQRLGERVRPRDRRGRLDLREALTVTIDGESARDFDDALTIERLENGHHWLGVHIADVSHYVRPGSALDAAAYRRATSVYFPERALHMFPASLATGLCSLNPGVDRLAHSCFMEVDARGRVLKSELHDTVIHSDHRLTYTEVDAILTARDDATRRRYEGVMPLLKMLQVVARWLHANRARRGSIDFDLKATRLVLDETGVVEDIVAADRNVAHRIVEACMLAANETVARTLEAAKMPALYRVHDAPDPAKVEEFEAFVGTLGHGLGAPADRVRPRHFQQLVRALRGTRAERAVAVLMLRTMQKARYEPVNRGHFGLASKSYTHFTSPIRRYPDLVVHRLLRELRRGAPETGRADELADTLSEVGRHTSDMERRAEEAERELVHWKKVRFMVDRVGETFSGYVIAATGFGLFVELLDPVVEGLVHISSMADDYYHFDETQLALRGESTGKRYRVGDEVEVRVVQVDTVRRRIDLGLTEILQAETSGPSTSRPRSRPVRGARPDGGGRRPRRRGRR